MRSVYVIDLMRGKLLILWEIKIFHCELIFTHTCKNINTFFHSSMVSVFLETASVIKRTMHDCTTARSYNLRAKM